MIARFVVAPLTVQSTCALCLVLKSKGQPPHVTVYFPEPVYSRLHDGLPSLQSDFRGRWMVGSTRTTAVKLRDWLHRYHAWEMVRDAETVPFGSWSVSDWQSYLARAS